MTLVSYSPWQDMNALQRQLNRMLDDALTPENWVEFNNLSKTPAAELIETDNALHLKLEVPGIQPQDIDIQAMADRVAISGERKSATQSKANTKTLSEFSYGKFQRVIPLPARIQNTEVTAGYKDGILSLTLPKAESEKNKVVKVSLSDAEATA
ncbi:MAG: Hsp20/alpha crystallin family protein [Cyanobacteria bacterium J06621_8]